jgi:hypothetical protein
VQTLGFEVTGFEGSITVEATLDSDPESAAWFDTYNYTAGAVVPISGYSTSSIVGNFTWLRIRIENFAAGTIESVTATY